MTNPKIPSGDAAGGPNERKQELARQRYARYQARHPERAKELARQRSTRYRARNPHPRAGQIGRPRSDAVTYRGAHLRVAGTRGKASEHPCIACESPANEWAYQGGAPDEQQMSRVDSRSGVAVTLRWSGDPAYYAPMCRSCHIKHDRRRGGKVNSTRVVPRRATKRNGDGCG